MPNLLYVNTCGTIYFGRWDNYRAPLFSEEHILASIHLSTEHKERPACLNIQQNFYKDMLLTHPCVQGQKQTCNKWALGETKTWSLNLDIGLMSFVLKLILLLKKNWARGHQVVINWSPSNSKNMFNVFSILKYVQGCTTCCIRASGMRENGERMRK